MEINSSHWALKKSIGCSHESLPCIMSSKLSLEHPLSDLSDNFCLILLNAWNRNFNSECIVELLECNRSLCDWIRNFGEYFFNVLFLDLMIRVVFHQLDECLIRHSGTRCTLFEYGVIGFTGAIKLLLYNIGNCMGTLFFLQSEERALLGGDYHVSWS